MSPFILQGGSFTYQLSPDLTKDPQLYAGIQALGQSMDRWARQVGLCINSNQAISGVTGARPTSVSLAVLPNSGVGYMFFDTTLGIPVWWKGAGWVNASGAPA